MSQSKTLFNVSGGNGQDWGFTPKSRNRKSAHIAPVLHAMDPRPMPHIAEQPVHYLPGVKLYAAFFSQRMAWVFKGEDWV